MTTVFRSFAAAAVASVVVVAAPAARAQGSQKIVYIQLQRVLQEAPGRAEAEKAYDREAGVARGEIQRMDDSLRALVQGFEKEAGALDSARREARAQSVRSVEERYTKRAQELNQRMQQRQSELGRPLMEQLSTVLDEVRKKNGYAFILDVNAQGSPIVSADSALDITNVVLARLKELGPPKPVSSQVPMPAAPAGPAARPAGVTRPRR